MEPRGRIEEGKDRKGRNEERRRKGNEYSSSLYHPRFGMPLGTIAAAEIERV